EPRQREGCGLAEIAGGKLAMRFAVGFPVPAATLVARALFARREGACLAAKGKGGGRLQPGIPRREFPPGSTSPTPRADRSAWCPGRAEVSLPSVLSRELRHSNVVLSRTGTPLFGNSGAVPNGAPPTSLPYTLDSTYASNRFQSIARFTQHGP